MHGSEERRMIARGFIAPSFLMLSLNKQDSTLIYRLGGKAKLSIIFIVSSNIIQNHVMLSGEGNDNGEKTTICT